MELKMFQNRLLGKEQTIYLFNIESFMWFGKGFDYLFLGFRVNIEKVFNFLPNLLQNILKVYLFALTEVIIKCTSTHIHI